MKASKKLIITLALVILVACVATGTTLAYLFADAPRLDNKFEPVSVTCEVVESFDGKLKSDVSIRNTGDVDAYIRATLVVTWTAADGTVHSSAPAESVDYSITYGSAKWVKGSDGFYWSRTAYSAQSGYYMGLLTSSVYPASYSSKYRGLAVRCVLK